MKELIVNKEANMRITDLLDKNSINLNASPQNKKEEETKPNRRQKETQEQKINKIENEKRTDDLLGICGSNA